MVFHWSLSDTKSPQVSRTFLSSLVVLSNVVIWVFGTVTKGLLKGLEDLEVGDHPKYYIIENGQNIEKSPGDLRRLAVTQTLVKSHKLTLM